MKQRIVGIDVARGLAVLGMFAAHLGYEDEGLHSPGWLVVADGRPSAMFAILAGLSIALFTGARTPPRGPALTHGWLRVTTRAAVIFVIGVLLMALGTPVAVILPSYAVTFLLVAPFLAARPTLVGFAAGAAAIIGPTVLAALLHPTGGGPAPVTTERGENVALDLVLTGYYPALVWIAYMLLGLCVGRLDLRSLRVQGALGLTGAGLLLIGHGGGDYLQATVTDPSPLVEQLIRTDPHADSTFEVLGNSGVTLLTLAVLLALTTPAALGRVTRAVLYPVAATGAMALSAYSVHIVVIAFLGSDVVWYPESNAVLVWFLLVTLAACTLWTLVLGRGPLERLMRVLTVGSYQPQRAAPTPPRT